MRLIETGGLADMKIAEENRNGSICVGSIYMIGYRTFKNASRRVTHEGAPEAMLFEHTLVGQARAWYDGLDEYYNYDLGNWFYSRVYATTVH